MIVYFKCHLIDGSERTHSYDLGKFNKLEQFVSIVIDAIVDRLEGGRALLMPNPNIIYAPGQVRCVEMSSTESTKEFEEMLQKKIGFVKD